MSNPDEDEWFNPYAIPVKTCTLKIQWCGESNPNKFGGSWHTPRVVQFENGADLIAQLQKISPCARWNTIHINAPDMVYAKDVSWDRLAPIVYEDITTRNNYMNIQRHTCKSAVFLQCVAQIFHSIRIIINV